MDRPSVSRVRRFDCNPGHCIRVSNYQLQNRDVHSAAVSFISNGNDSLMHYGVPGQKWGVITKEYKPVAIDHRKLRKSMPKSRIKARLEREKELRDKEYLETRETWKNMREENQKKTRVAGTVLGAGLLLISAFAGYKIAKIRPSIHAQNALKSLTALKPNRARMGKLVDQGMWFGIAQQEKAKGNAIGRLGGHIRKAGVLLSGRRYRDKLRQARSFLSGYRNI